VSLAYRCSVMPCPSISWMRSKVYKTNSSGPRTDPCGTPHKRRVTGDRRPENTVTNVLRPSDVIRLKLQMRVVVDAEDLLQAPQQNVVIDGVEGCR